MDAALEHIKSGNAGTAIEMVVSELDQVRRSMTAAAWRVVARWAAAHPIAPHLYKDPFTHRAYTKPRGYAGDAVMMDFIYGINRPQPSPDAAELTRYTTELGCSARAVRYRRQLLAETIDDAAVRHGRPVHVTAVACGHLREAALSSAVQQGLAYVTAIDQDRDSLVVVQRDYGDLGINTVDGSVRQILTGRLPLTPADLIYSAGLYDYLTAPVAARLTEMLFGALAPGGRLLLANFMPGIPNIGYMESFMDWHLIYRDDAQMRALTSGLPATKVATVRQFHDPLDAITFLEVTRT